MLAPRPVPPLAHLLGGAMNEAALWLAGTDEADRPAALESVWAELPALLDALR